MNRHLSVNRLAWRLLEPLLNEPSYYGLKVHKTDSGTVIVDAGMEVKGGFLAGKLITEICMGGCAEVALTSKCYGDLELLCVFVSSDKPVVATLGSQYAGWQINEKGYFAIGSGPARALALKPNRIYQEIKYEDDCDRAIMVLEAEKTPPRTILTKIVDDCRVSPEKLVVIITPTTSIAGSMQISGRIVETGIHKLRKMGLDPNVILQAWGVAPVSPVSPKFAVAMARTNDAILYGGIASYVVDCDNDKELVALVKQAPSEASKDYGKPFSEILEEAGGDFYRIDANLFAPAVIAVNNVKTGKTFVKGHVNVKVLTESFDIQKLK